jgi:hypothetical protein
MSRRAGESSEGARAGTPEFKPFPDAEASRLALDLKTTRIFESGVVLLGYKPAA